MVGLGLGAFGGCEVDRPEAERGEPGEIAAQGLRLRLLPSRFDDDRQPTRRAKGGASDLPRAVDRG